MLSFTSSGSTDNMERFLKSVLEKDIFSTLERFGSEGVAALTAATPKDTAETANSWYYEILQDETSYSIIWGNTKIIDGRPIAILLQYGHGTGTGGYVQGYDYINPAMRGLFDSIADAVWKEVKSA